jgi:hypothetical protein
LPKSPKHNYCETPNKKTVTYVGCYADKPGDPDFEKNFSGSTAKPDYLRSIDQCKNKAFRKGYIYFGLSDGGVCWGGSKKIGKYGESD